MRTEWCPDCGQVFDSSRGHVCSNIGYRPRALCLHCKFYLDADGACRNEACVRSKTGEVQEALASLYAVSVPPHEEVEEPVKLHALAPAKNPDVIEKLEDLLARARSGELQAIAVAGITSDGGASTVWAGDRWAALLGCTFDLLCRLREEGKPPER